MKNIKDNQLKVAVVFFALVSLASCGGGGDKVVNTTPSTPTPTPAVLPAADEIFISGSVFNPIFAQTQR